MRMNLSLKVEILRAMRLLHRIVLSLKVTKKLQIFTMHRVMMISQFNQKYQYQDEGMCDALRTIQPCASTCAIPCYLYLREIC